MSIGSTAAGSVARKPSTCPALPPRAVLTACARDAVPGTGCEGRSSEWVKNIVPVEKIRKGFEVGGLGIGGLVVVDVGE